MPAPFSTRLLLIALASFAQPNPSLAGEDSVVFDRATFILRFAPKDSKVELREYLPEGETLEKWERMLSSRTFRDLDDSKAYALKLAQEVVKSDPLARSQILRSDKTGCYVVDFLVFSPENSEPRFAEWNLMRVEKQTTGLRVTQYAKRFYTIDEKMPKEIIAAREKILPQLEKLTLP